ncbi:MAG: hypothetical protein REI78_11260 [Pedobacter sp.]|nr:hypothetical protein [Pedobacter sp.]MDQ8053600.1 hypothetical protein [Pedobacter sp.]
MEAQTPIDILIVGTNRSIMETIARLIDKDGEWLATIANNQSEALAICRSKDFGLALIGAGLSPSEEEELQQAWSANYPNMPIVKHYGGGSGLLYAEIYKALGN